MVEFLEDGGLQFLIIILMFKRHVLSLDFFNHNDISRYVNFLFIFIYVS